MATAHQFEERLSWRAGGNGATTGNCAVTLAARPHHLERAPARRSLTGA